MNDLSSSSSLISTVHLDATRNKQHSAIYSSGVIHNMYSMLFSSAKRMSNCMSWLLQNMHHVLFTMKAIRCFSFSANTQTLEQRCCLPGIVRQHADGILCFSTQHAQHCVFLENKQILLYYILPFIWHSGCTS